MVAELPRASAIVLNVSSAGDVDSQIRSHDLVISLVPYIYHPAIIKPAIKYKVNAVTSSYVSAAIRELDGLAKEAGVVVSNEVGYEISTFEGLSAPCFKLASSDS